MEHTERGQIYSSELISYVHRQNDTPNKFLWKTVTNAYNETLFSTPNATNEY